MVGSNCSHFLSICASISSTVGAACAGAVSRPAPTAAAATRISTRCRDATQATRASRRFQVVTMRGHGCHRHRLLCNRPPGASREGRAEADDPQRSVPHIREAWGGNQGERHHHHCRATACTPRVFVHHPTIAVNTSSSVTTPSGRRPSLTSTMCRRSRRMASSSSASVRSGGTTASGRIDVRPAPGRRPLPGVPEHVLDVHEAQHPPGRPLHHREAGPAGPGGQHLQRRRRDVLGHRGDRRPRPHRVRGRAGRAAPARRRCGRAPPGRADPPYAPGSPARPAPRR